MKIQTFRLPATFRFFAVLSVAFGLAPFLLTSCGGGNSQATQAGQSAISVTISATSPGLFVGGPGLSTTVIQGGTLQFTANVTGTVNAAVTWTVQEGAAGGSITSAGTYTAPNTPGVYHVAATSQADTAKHDTATITVPEISISIPTAITTINPGGTKQFTANVTGTVNAAVTWTVQEGAAGGTITSTGFYTAPASLGTFHLIAICIADNSKSATATVSVAEFTGAFIPTGRMNKVLGIHTATLLPDGKVLMAGGSLGSDADWVEVAQRDAELYDPAATLFATTGTMTSDRVRHTATLLPNGKVFMAGGFGESSNGPYSLSSAEVYDSASGGFTGVGNMTTVRAVHTATLLPDAKVLIAGGGESGGLGFPSFGLAFTTAEVYDPVANSVAPTGAMGTPRYAHTATLLPNGKVLIAGGFSAVSLSATTASGALSSAELYDPATGVFMPTGSMGTARGGHTATLLRNGKVLVAGGMISLGVLPYSQNDSVCTGSPDTLVALTAELYDPATGAFTPTGDMTATREEHTATLLPDGKVLIVGGGTSSQGVLGTAERYDPATGTFTVTANMGTPRTAHTATLLQDGTVLIAGGNFAGGRFDTVCSYKLGSAEIFKELP